MFEPSGQGGARGGGAISDGKYAVDIDRGMWAGSFTVRITGTRETGNTEAAFESLEGESGEAIAEVEEIVPREFNSQSSLTVNFVAGENSKDFDLTGERGIFDEGEEEY